MGRALCASVGDIAADVCARASVCVVRHRKRMREAQSAVHSLAPDQATFTAQSTRQAGTKRRRGSAQGDAESHRRCRHLEHRFETAP